MSTCRPHHKLLGLLAIACIVLAGYVAWSLINPPTYEVEYSIPSRGARVIAGFTPMHLYLAEYERSVVVLAPDGKRLEAKLFPDTGGYERSQLYRAPDGILYLKGHFDVARIDLDTPSIEVIATSIPKSVEYPGAFDYAQDVGWKFLSPDESPERQMQ